jgi:hypothetical protein
MFRHLRARWIFRLALDEVSTNLRRSLDVRSLLRGARHYLVAFPIYLHYWGWTVALVHASVVWPAGALD